MRRTWPGRKVLITGASSGIGRALAKDLAAAGASLVLTARSVDQLEALRHELADSKGTIVICRADITVAQDRQKLIDTVASELGGLDVLVNNAGVVGTGHFSTSDESLMRQTMETNFFAPVELMRLAVPLLMRGREPCVLNMSSVCGRRGIPARPEYSASRFALCGFSEALRAEFVRFDIDVLLVLPGLVNREGTRNLLRDDAKMNMARRKGMDVGYVVKQIRRAIERNAKETVLGSDAKWMLRMNRWFPRWLDQLIARRVKKLYEGERPA